jgi:hypothetical protein
LTEPTPAFAALSQHVVDDYPKDANAGRNCNANQYGMRHSRPQPLYFSKKLAREDGAASLGGAGFASARILSAIADTARTTIEPAMIQPFMIVSYLQE